MNNRALVAMSGGVDSSVAALLMKDAGYDCAGAMMKLFHNEDIGLSPERGCCSLADAQDARAVAYRLGLDFFVMNFSDAFDTHVIGRFARAYRCGETPNPCIDCNRFLKFERFLSRAQEMDRDVIATGHYARVTRDASGRRLLHKGVDEGKDQSYVLYTMTQDQLARTRLPLGSLRKSEVRDIAREHGFVNAKKRDSQDICFVPNGDYAGFIAAYTGKQDTPGAFVDPAGRVLGAHKGVTHYTVGQRRGLGLSMPRPIYVQSIDPDANTVTVAENEALFSTRLVARDINLIAFDALSAPLRAHAKIRYKHEAAPAIVHQTDADTLLVEFEKPQRAITPGQAVVLYDGDVVLGGGTICTRGRWVEG